MGRADFSIFIVLRHWFCAILPMCTSISVCKHGLVYVRVTRPNDVSNYIIPFEPHSTKFAFTTTTKYKIAKVNSTTLRVCVCADGCTESSERKAHKLSINYMIGQQQNVSHRHVCVCVVCALTSLAFMIVSCEFSFCSRSMRQPNHMCLGP